MPGGSKTRIPKNYGTVFVVAPCPARDRGHELGVGRGRDRLEPGGGVLTTDRRVFHSELLVSEHWPESREEGVVTLRIPEHTVPSFAAPHNKIEWLLSVTGETKFTNTPDIEFPITVRPPQGGKPSEETRR